MANSFDVIRFVRDHNVQAAGYDDRHYREGWVNIPCPFCVGNPGNHLGFPVGGGKGWHCHRCGGHGVAKVIAAILKITDKEARRLAKAYGARPQAKGEREDHNRPATVKLPTGCEGPLPDTHRYYLKKRGFDPDLLEPLWDLKGTGFLGPYKFRIVAPIFLDGRLVSYQGRDITDRAPLKYKACQADLEVIPHAEMLYGIDKAQGHSAVVVEGITDTWRLGPGAVATFGIEWDEKQALMLRKFSRVFVMYDFGEEQAQEQARKLAATLSGLGTTVEMLMVPGHKGDPAELSEKKAKRLMEEIL